MGHGEVDLVYPASLETSPKDLGFVSDQAREDTPHITPS